ncbi:MAG: hypothetical protein JO286_05395 [Solirubrobacterales bacterium]|nr:hypothetical protein [Solirubrobacterales bacterium]
MTFTRRHWAALGGVLVCAVVFGALLLMLRGTNGPAGPPVVTVTTVSGGARALERERPAGADAFIDSVGVNIHSTYVDTAYGDRTRVIETLRDLGVHNVRDGLIAGRPDQREYDLELAQYGIRTTFIMGAPNADIVSGLDGSTRAFLARTAAAFEGPNEYDASGDPQWTANLRAYQQRLYRAVKDDHVLASLPVIAPSLVNPGSPEQLGSLDGLADMANAHPYPGALPPEESLDMLLPGLEDQAAGRPIVATEDGYTNALATQGDHPPVSERAAAIYLPRMLLENFRRGIKRTFIYELLDEKPDPSDAARDEHFGLVRNDFSPKPAYWAIRTLLHVLSGPGGGHGEQPPLSLALSQPPAVVHHLLLAGGVGTYYLALWRPVSVWDTIRRTDVYPTPIPVQVRFGNALGSVEVFDPSRSQSALERFSDRRDVELNLTGDAVLLRIRPE